MVMQNMYSRSQCRICACEVLMTGSKEFFNNKIKIALLILIWSSIWNSCKCIGVEDNGNHAVYNNNNNDNNKNMSNLYEQLEINIGGENEAFKAIFMGNSYALREILRSFDNTTRSKNYAVLFKRETTAPSESEQRESSVGFAESGTNAESPHKKEAQYVQQEQSSEAQNEIIATTTRNDNNIYVITTTEKNNVEINENQNEKNNDNENVKWPKVVDSEIIPTTTIAPESAKALFTEIPPKSAAATATNDEEELNQANEAPKLQTEPPLVDVTAALQQKLIYEFAIKYKLIPHVTFFTCRWLSGGSHGTDSNFGEQMTYLNMQTLEIMERMYDSRRSSNLAVDKKRSEAGAPKAKKSVPAETKRNTTRASGNSNSNRMATSTQTTTTPNGNARQRGSGANSRSLAATSLRDILIKVVHIDQLMNKRSFAAFKNKNAKNDQQQQQQQRNNWNAKRAFGGGYNADGGRFTGSADSRNAYTNANWLTEVLRDVGNRQIVVLNLACGAASRRLLEMASIKALFNSTYHWLLIEDYTFNRHADNDDNVNKSNNNQNNCNTARTDQNNESVDDNTNNDDVDDDDVESAVDKFSQRKQRQQQENGKLSQSEAAFTNTSAATVTRTAIAAPATVNNEETMEIIEKYLEKINININTELILAKRHTRRIRDNVDVGGEVQSCRTDSESATNNTLQRTDYYQLYDVWNPGLQYGGQLNISEIGYFALDDGLQIALWYRRSTTITRRMNMKMARIRCLIVVTNKNFTDTLEHYLTTPYDTHLDSMNRFNFALLSNVRDLYNFSFVMSKTASWGYLKNGKFDGMIGALVRKQADIGGSPIFFRIERAKVIDYTTRTWVARPCFIFRHPPSTKKDRIVFLQPFSNTVWILLGLCGIFTICLLWLLTTVERKLAAAGVVRQLGIRNDTRGSVNKTNNKSKQQQAIGVNDEQQVRDACSAWLTVSDGGTMPCGGVYKNAFSSLGRATKEQQRKQKLQKLVKRDKRERRQKHEQNISFRHCMLGCGNACCGQTGTDVAQQRVGLFFESLLFYVGSICQQGLTFSTSFFSGRCIVITSLLFAFAIYQFYSASIVGTLLMEKPKTIRTLRDLIHSSLAVGVEDIPYNRDYFLRTKDPVSIELYAKKVTSVLTDNDPLSDMAGENASTLPTVQPTVQLTEAEKAKAYRDILHSHETGAHAKTNEASNWYEPEYGVERIRRGKFAFHVDVATAYKIIADTFNEKEICDLTEIQLFPPQKMVNIVQKGSPLRKIITYGLRRVTETGLMDYQRKVWHSRKPRCVKQIHTDDLRVDLQTFASALLVLIFGYAVSLLALSIEIIQHKLYERHEQEHEEEEEEEGHEDVGDDENVEQEYE